MKFKPGLYIDIIISKAINVLLHAYIFKQSMHQTLFCIKKQLKKNQTKSINNLN